VVVEAKICGVTRPEDAALAAAHGAWRLGVIFASGPRLVDVARAREIVSAASGVPVLGVFGTQSVAEISDLSAAAGLAGAQLHGPSSPAIAARLRANGLEVWRVASIEAGFDLVQFLAERGASADALLIEPRHHEGSGGKGVVLSPDLAVAARKAAPAVRFVLAGGLGPENVGERIRLVRPDVVDVSSGVESSPGRKDRQRLLQFLEIVRDARASS
jgi:phosphoribosylanthranilate isomerase